MAERPESLISDPKALRALSHPVRWKLINLLTGDVTATATRCAEITGESVASCSYHLKMLAKYGFVEQAEGGQGREKPWKLTSSKQNFTDVGLDEEGKAAALSAIEALLDNELAETKARFRHRGEIPQDWLEFFGIDSVTTFVTHDEMAEWVVELRTLLSRFSGRVDDPAKRPPDAAAVRLFTVSSWIPRQNKD